MNRIFLVLQVCLLSSSFSLATTISHEGEDTPTEERNGDACAGCQATSISKSLCVGAKYCKKGDEYDAPNAFGGCPAGWGSPTEVTDINDACTHAAGWAKDDVPGCTNGCEEDISTGQDVISGSCCSVQAINNCSNPGPQPTGCEAEVVEPLENSLR